MSVRLLVGDCRDRLCDLADQSVQCVITSPPYFNLRDYGVDGQLGMEATPEAFTAALVEVFRLVRRVLRDDGTIWLVLGDSYAGSWGNQGRKSERGTQRPINGPIMQNLQPYPNHSQNTGKIPAGSHLKPKDLIGIPWRAALALQADGWWLRSDIIWHKPNPMPMSITDRPTTSHEYVFLLTKKARYYYDHLAIREPGTLHGGNAGTFKRENSKRGIPMVGQSVGTHRPERDDRVPSGANKRSVWTISTSPYKGAHFATFPVKLVEPCLLAGTSEHGCCPTCGASWRRVVERTADGQRKEVDRGFPGNPQASGGASWRPVEYRASGWAPSCKCPPHDPRPCVVLDPFAGAGTVGLVAQRHNRHAILIELNPAYVELARERLVSEAPLLAEVTVESIGLIEVA